MNLQNNFNKNLATKDKLFRVDIDGRNLYDLYINSFKDDPIWRDPESSFHNCNTCSNFLRRYGNIVAIDDDMSIVTLFSNYERADEYGIVFAKLDHHLKNLPIKGVFIETFDVLNNLPYDRCKRNDTEFQLGTVSNTKVYTKEEANAYEQKTIPGEVYVFEHLNVKVPAKFISIGSSMGSASVESLVGIENQKHQVFQRFMEEIELGTIDLALELIQQGSLLDANQFEGVLNVARKLKEEYDEQTNKPNWLWWKSASIKEATAKFKNTLMGVFLTELQSIDINDACKNWNKRVDPANYHKAKAPITKAQIEAAKKFVEQNGFENSFSRVTVGATDINVSEILHINRESSIKPVSIFDDVKPTVSKKKPSFDGIEEVSIDKFMSDILPNVTRVQAFVENRHEGNFVTLTKPSISESKPILKWDNGFSWTFKGNLAGKSQIKEEVARKGGNVKGVLNFRLAWNMKGVLEGDSSDLDAWAKEIPGGAIGYSTSYRAGRGKRSPRSGQLDVDNMNPRGKIAVENITWTDLSKMKDGVIALWVNQYSARNSKGFEAEIEFDGEIFHYTWHKPIPSKRNIRVAEITIENKKFSIKHLIPHTNSSKEIWGIGTGEFHDVSLLSLSPNHWGENKVGNKHYMFMLKGCKPEGMIRSFHNEHLIEELKPHRKTLEVLGSKNMVQASDNTLAGIGFNSTVKDEVILKLEGNFNRTIKIKF